MKASLLVLYERHGAYEIINFLLSKTVCKYDKGEA